MTESGDTPADRPVTRAAAEAARERLRGIALRSPLLRLEHDGDVDVRVKLENLQPIGSFKIRGAANKMLQLAPDVLRRGVWTASAGNMAQGVAWCARRAGIECTVVVPEHASEAKLAAIRRLGARIETVTHEEFFETFATRRRPGLGGQFIHAFSDADVMAGNGTIALEILEDLPDVRAIYVPYGGGGSRAGLRESSARLLRMCASSRANRRRRHRSPHRCRAASLWTPVSPRASSTVPVVRGSIRRCSLWRAT